MGCRPLQGRGPQRVNYDHHPPQRPVQTHPSENQPTMVSHETNCGLATNVILQQRENIRHGRITNTTPPNTISPCTRQPTRPWLGLQHGPETDRNLTWRGSYPLTKLAQAMVVIDKGAAGDHHRREVPIHQNSRCWLGSGEPRKSWPSGDALQ